MGTRPSGLLVSAGPVSKHRALPPLLPCITTSRPPEGRSERNEAAEEERVPVSTRMTSKDSQGHDHTKNDQNRDAQQLNAPRWQPRNCFLFTIRLRVGTGRTTFSNPFVCSLLNTTAPTTPRRKLLQNVSHHPEDQTRPRRPRCPPVLGHRTRLAHAMTERHEPTGPPEQCSTTERFRHVRWLCRVRGFAACR